MGLGLDGGWGDNESRAGILPFVDYLNLGPSACLFLTFFDAPHEEFFIITNLHWAALSICSFIGQPSVGGFGCFIVPLAVFS